MGRMALGWHLAPLTVIFSRHVVLILHQGQLEMGNLGLGLYTLKDPHAVNRSVERPTLSIHLEVGHGPGY